MFVYILNQEAYIVTEINFAKTYSPLTSAEIVAQEKSNMDEKRFKHCIGVSETSRKLIRTYLTILVLFGMALLGHILLRKS